MSHYNIDSCFFDEYNLHKRMEDVGVNEEKWEYDTDSDRIAAAVKSAEKTINRFRLLAELERELFSKEEEEGYTISEYNREKYYCQLEILDRLRTMQEIQSIWDTEDDGSFTDEWFGNRSEEYRNALYSRPTDELAELMPKIDFRGKKLAYHSGLSDIGLILRDDSDLDGIYYNNISYRSIDNLTTYKMSVPFEPHSIWNALLLLMSAHWMWKPKMYILCPIREDGVRLVPRVTMYGDKALATFCSMDLRSYEKEGIRSIYKNAIYVQREGTSFEILAGYSVYYGNCNDVSLSSPDVTPPLHYFTHIEKRRIEEGIVENMESLKEFEQNR